MIDGSGPWALRLRNGQAVFDEFMEAAPFPISRATLARRTGLSKPTVSALVSDLEHAGVVSLIPPERSQGRIGRPATPYALVPDAALVVGVDMGATKIIVGIADLLGRVLAEDRIGTASDARAAVGSRGGKPPPACSGIWGRGGTSWNPAAWVCPAFTGPPRIGSRCRPTCPGLPTCLSGRS